MCIELLIHAGGILYNRDQFFCQNILPEQQPLARLTICLPKGN